MHPKRRRTRRLSRAVLALALPASLAAGTAACAADYSAVLTTVRDSAGITIVENAPGAADAVQGREGEGPEDEVGVEYVVRSGVREGAP